MRFMVFKVIMFLAVFIFMQGAVLPWAISNNLMPLWADIILISLILVMWSIVIERLAEQILKTFRRSDELPS